MYVLSNFGDQFSERFFPAVHLDHSHSRNDLIHDLYPLVCVDSSLVSVNKCRELLLCQRLVTVRIAYTCNFNLIQPIFFFYLKCIFSYYAYNYKNKKGNQFKQSVITINILIDMYDLFITFGRQKCISNYKSSLYTKIVHYQLNWYKLHLKLHLCNPLMSNNPIGLNFVYICFPYNIRFYLLERVSGQGWGWFCSPELGKQLSHQALHRNQTEQNTEAGQGGGTQLHPQYNQNKDGLGRSYPYVVDEHHSLNCTQTKNSMELKQEINYSTSINCKTY